MAPRASHVSGALGTAVTYFVKSGDGQELGPYAARLVVLTAINWNAELSTVLVRRTDDPPDLWTPASQEEAIASEYSRRTGGRVPQGGSLAGGNTPANPALEAAWGAAIKNGSLSREAVDMLAQILVGLGQAANRDQAIDQIVKRAAAQNVPFE